MTLRTFISQCKSQPPRLREWQLVLRACLERIEGVGDSCPLRLGNPQRMPCLRAPEPWSVELDAGRVASHRRFPPSRFRPANTRINQARLLGRGSANRPACPVRISIPNTVAHSSASPSDRRCVRPCVQAQRCAAPAAKRPWPYSHSSRRRRLLEARGPRDWQVSSPGCRTDADPLNSCENKRRYAVPSRGWGRQRKNANRRSCAPYMIRSGVASIGNLRSRHRRANAAERISLNPGKT